MKYKYKKITDNLISELAFKLILDSEEIEGFELGKNVISENTHLMNNISKDLTLQFLELPETKVHVAFDEENDRNVLLAHNSTSNETIKISGLADHYLTLLKVIEKAFNYQPNQGPILTHDFIKDINLSLQTFRKGERGIGEYRPVVIVNGKDFPIESYITTKINNNLSPIKSIDITPQKDVEKDMDILIDWVNNTAFREGRDYVHDVAEFQARFFKIHPFTDGNGRTARLISNYLLIANNQPIISFPFEKKKEYNLALNYANSRNIKESTKDIGNFEKYIRYKYKKEHESSFIDFFNNKDNTNNRKKDKKYKIINTSNNIEHIIEDMQKKHDTEDKYKYLTEFFRQNMIVRSSKKAIDNILFNYGKKNEDKIFDAGSFSAEQI